MTEYQLHTACMEWVEWQTNQLPELGLLHHSPNGGHRHKAVAAKLRRMGVRPGFPDLFLPVPRGPWHGLFIELKVSGGKPSESQRLWIDRLRYLGYRVEVIKSQADFERVVLEYLQHPGRTL